ncbi:MAG: Gfo/Idh/MocA family oxidoreductase [Pirellulaceae bacterium]|nr:Gfo/Idh/MocA family oxidoreductase [Pirellulaceae bacterium]
MAVRWNRRQFLSATAGTALAWGYHSGVSRAADPTSPNERLNLASIGVLGRAGGNLSAVASQNIVALADVDAGFLDQAAARYPQTRKYRDYREMLEREADKLDGVLVSTPDHSHAPAAAMALRLKLPVYCEKPLTHTVYEARTLANLAAAGKLATQMGTQIHAGDNYRRVVELVQGGVIGPVRRAHVWAGAQYSGATFTLGTAAPDSLNWDLWLGPASERPYSEGVHPFKWRSFWDYGTGALGDFGCHYMDLAHWALRLRHPTTIAAQGPPYDPVSTPAWCIVDYEYPARGDLPPVHLTWYDSGRRPDILATLKDSAGQPLNWNSGQLFIGDEGMILSDYSRHVLLPAEKFADFQPPPASIPASVGHHREWIEAIRQGTPTTCNFDYSGALTEAVLLGTVAYRSGKKLEWDAENLRVTNAPDAQQFIHKEYRKGWTL